MDYSIWLTAILGALIGGLLLNLMPCVFPILSLKALSLSKMSMNKKAAQVDGLWYAAGSVLTASFLGIILLLLRSAGQEVGWSFQLQSPHMIMILFILVISIGLNFAGFFEVRAPSISGPILSQAGWKGSFLTGILAAIIGTPCSGPFMAGALGAALFLPPAAAILVFASLGLGMALPFVAIAFIPSLQKIMPKPGNWMITFRKLLSIPMFITGIALLWVLGRQAGTEGITIALSLIAVVAVCLWWFGDRQREGLGAKRALMPAIVATSIALAGNMDKPAPLSAPVSDLHQSFNAEKLIELRAAGKPIFVDFTADWCLTCKVNEKAAIDRKEVQDAFLENGVVTVEGDWTNGDPEITKFLAENGRNSIPFYLYYAPGKEARILPQILSTELLVEMANEN